MKRRGPEAGVDPVEMALIQDVERYVSDPLGFSRYIFPWRQPGVLQDDDGPRKWQGEILATIRDHLKSPKRFEPLRIAVASGKGIGKSALVGMVSNWGMSTCGDCKIVLTANTDPQLRTKTWPEVCKWFGMALNAHWFNVEAESITVLDRKQQWRMDRIPWSENRPEAFAGLHNKGKRIIILFDESSSIADIIWDTTQGALTDEGTEIIWLAFGNPTRNTGRFKEIFGKLRHRWITRQIDSREVEGINKKEVEQAIEDYGGEDSDGAKIYYRGLFPSRSSTQFIPSDLVDFCLRYKAQSYEHLPKVLTVDVARFGHNQTVIGWRQGRKAVICGKYRGLDTVQVAERAIEFVNSEKPDATVVDGDGVGAGVVDQMKARKYKIFEFHGAHKASDSEQYFNRRAECWGLLRDWLKEGAELPDDKEVAADLTGPEYLLSRKGQIQLERKEDMERRGLASPDIGDMLAMSFSVDIAVTRTSKVHERPAGMSQTWMSA